MLLHLLLQPVLQALVVDEPDRAVALARVEQRIRIALLIAPTHLALDVALSRVDNPAVDFDGLLGEVISPEPVLIVDISLPLFAWTQALSLVASVEGRRTDLGAEVLDLELNAAELDDVSLPQAVVLNYQ